MPVINDTIGKYHITCSNRCGNNGGCVACPNVCTSDGLVCGGADILWLDDGECLTPNLNGENWHDTGRL